MKGFMIRVFDIKAELSFEELTEAIRKSKVPGMVKITLAAYIMDMISLEYSQKKPGRAQVISRIERAKVLLNLIVRNMPSKSAEAGKAGKVAKTGKPKESGVRNLKYRDRRKKIMRQNLVKAYRLGLEVRRAMAKSDYTAAVSKMDEIKSISKKLPKSERIKLIESVSTIENEITSVNDKSTMNKGDGN
jgi:hypothetical protein